MAIDHSLNRRVQIVLSKPAVVQCIIILEPHLSTTYSWRFLLLSYPEGNLRSYNDAWLSCRQRSEIRLGFGLVWFNASRPGKQLFSHFGTEPSFPVYNQYFFFFFFFGGGGDNLAQGHNTVTRVGFEPPDFWIQSPRY